MRLPRTKFQTVYNQKGLNAKKLRQWTGALGHRMVDITLPSFKYVSRIRLKNVLIALGVGNAFGGGADFSGMSGHRSLFISDAGHKAFVEVDEKGAEAPAATAVVLMRGTVWADPPPSRWRCEPTGPSSTSFWTRSRARSCSWAGWTTLLAPPDRMQPWRHRSTNVWCWMPPARGSRRI